MKHATIYANKCFDVKSVYFMQAGKSFQKQCSVVKYGKSNSRFKGLYNFKFFNEKVCKVFMKKLFYV